MFVHVTAVQYVNDYKLRLTFNNGVTGMVDLQPELYGEIFEPLQDKSLFQQVYLTGRTIEWPNGADFAPEFLLTLVKQELSLETQQLAKASSVGSRTVREPEDVLLRSRPSVLVRGQHGLPASAKHP